MVIEKKTDSLNFLINQIPAKKITYINCGKSKKLTLEIHNSKYYITIDEEGLLVITGPTGTNKTNDLESFLNIFKDKIDCLYVE